MFNRLFKNMAVGCCFVFVAVTIILGQDGQTRSITSEDFTNKRPDAPKTKKPKRRPSAAPKNVIYNSKKAPKIRIGWKTAGMSANRPKPTGKMIANDIGVTIWKMRPPLPTDPSGVQLLVSVNGRNEWWSPVRVDPSSVFSAGDKIRLGIESKQAGYLYVINSEVSADGNFGVPRLLFPVGGATFNFVSPGMLVDIPDQKESHPYFNLEPNKGNYAGEILAVIISPVKLDFELDRSDKILNIGSVLDLDSEIDLQIFASAETNGTVFSQAETGAACATRELVREKRPESACPNKTRSLTREAPPPQTIYRINAYPGRPAIALVRLSATN